MFEFGGTKKAEYIISAELFEAIAEEKGAFFALAFLLNAQYERKDLIEILKYLTPKKLNKGEDNGE